MARTRTSGQGRPKGALNKVNADVKAMILQALSGAGGAKYLQSQATKSPAAFMALVGKVLPLQVTGADGGPQKIVISWENTPSSDEP